MNYCGPRGLPHGEFLSWPEDDQQKALWWDARRRQTCSGCQTHPDEWDEEAGGSRHAYTAEERICPGCRALDVARADLERARQNHEPKHGVHVVLIKHTDDEPEAP